MQVTAIQPVTQPFFKLIQANTDLLTRFSPSPEAFSRSLTEGQRLLQQTQGSLTKIPPQTSRSNRHLGTVAILRPLTQPAYAGISTP